MKEDILILWFSESPDAGHPECICSYCYRVIEDTAIRAWNEKSKQNTEVLELRFHVDCAKKIGFFNNQVPKHHRLLVRNVPGFLEHQEKIVAQAIYKSKALPVEQGQKEEKKTSEQWLVMCMNRFGLILFDFKGWDQNNFRQSFNEELITKEEFIQRVQACAIHYDNNQFLDWVDQTMTQ